MWLRVLCVLAVSDALGGAVARRIYEGESHAQESGGENRTTSLEEGPGGSAGVLESTAGDEPSASALVRIEDQDGSGSALVTRGLPAGPTGLQHTFGVNVEQPLGENPIRVAEQQYHPYREDPRDQQRNQEINSVQNDLVSSGGAWRGIDRFRVQEHGHELHQHQVLGQVLQGLGQVNQVLGQNHQGVQQVNQIFGLGLQDHDGHMHFNYAERELYRVGENQEEVDNHQEVNHGSFGEIVNNNIIENTDTKKYNFGYDYKPIVNNDLAENKETNNYNFGNDYKPAEHLKISQPPKHSEKVVVNTEGVKTTTITKEVPVPYTIEVEKKIPYTVEVPIEKPYPVEVRKPYPVYVEKRVPYTVKEFVPQPYTVYKRIPYQVKVHVSKPYAVPVLKPYRVLVEKKVPYQVEKRVPYPVHVYVDKPYPVHVPVLRTIPYTVEKKVPLPVQVTVEKPYPVPVPRPYNVYVEKPTHLPTAEPLSMYHAQDLGLFRPIGSGDQNSPVEPPWHQPQPQLMEPTQYPVHGLQAPGRSGGEGFNPQSAPDQGYHMQPQWREPMQYPSNYPRFDGMYRHQEQSLPRQEAAGWHQPQQQRVEPRPAPQGVPGYGQNPHAQYPTHHQHSHPHAHAQTQHYS